MWCCWLCVMPSQHLLRRKMQAVPISGLSELLRHCVGTGIPPTTSLTRHRDYMLSLKQTRPSLEILALSKRRGMWVVEMDILDESTRGSPPIRWKTRTRCKRSTKRFWAPMESWSGIPAWGRVLVLPMTTPGGMTSMLRRTASGPTCQEPIVERPHLMIGCRNLVGL